MISLFPYYNLSDESKLFFRFIFASLVLWGQFIIGKKILTYLVSKKNKPKSSSDSYDQSQSEETSLFIEHRLARTVYETLTVPERASNDIFGLGSVPINKRKFKAKLFVLKKTQQYLKKERMKMAAFENSQSSQLWWWYRRKIFQLTALIKWFLTWKDMSELMDYTIQERLQILLFQIKLFLKKLRKTRHRSPIIMTFVAAVACVAIGLYWRIEIFEYFTNEISTAGNSVKFDLFSLDELGDKILPGDLLEIISVSNAHQNGWLSKVGVMEKSLKTIHVRIVRHSA